MKWFSLFLICTPSLFGIPVEECIDLQASKQTVIDHRENYFQTSTPYKISPNVSPITGDLIEEEIDLVVAGCEPLSIRRFYNHTAPYEPRSGGWRYNPEAFFVANFEWAGQETFAAAGTADGSITSFKPSANVCSFNPEGFINFTPSGQTHPLNTKINYSRVPSKKKGYFSYRGEIVDGSGAKRSFDSGPHCWLSNLITDVKRKSRDIHIDMYTPNCWTPYQLHVHEEKRPNGNIICYSIATWKDCKHFRKPHLLSGITAYNSDKTKVLASISFAYNKDKHEDVRGITATGSDGRQISLQHQGNSPILLTAAFRPDLPSVSYGYQRQWINRVEKPDGRVITTEYNAEGKVSAQCAPVGPNGEMHPIGRYVYHVGATEVYDAEGNKIIYRFNDKKQILSLETYQNNILYRVDCFNWDSNGNLVKKTIENGAGNILQITEYKYDKNHNPIEEKTGDGAEWHTIFRTFSDDGFNLKLTESDKPGRITHYAYLPGTSLLISELLYEGNIIRQRTFHTYDNAAVCIKTIVDDGSTADANNLHSVTYRTIIEIQPKQTMPCFGLPEVILEKTINAAGEEIFLKKIHYTYTPFGKVAKEDHYDCNDVYCYSIHNEYDSKERLIATQDALGNRTTYTYDDNSNLISISGPRNDQHKEITHDRANRPIRIADWQTDGSILITEKQYNKLGQVIAEIDACGNVTRFEYDALGRCTAVIHPDTGVERREYNVLGYITSEINTLDQQIHKTYNFKGQPLSFYYPDGSEEHFTYFAHGPTASYTDKNGAETIYSLDVFDHPIKTEIYSPCGKLLKITTACYSAFHKLSETDSKGVTTFYSYDFAGKKIAEQKDYSKHLFVYDSLGRLEKTQEGEIAWIEKHDFLGQVIEKRTEKNGTLQFQEKYLYDPGGNRIQIINSQGVHAMEFNTYGKPITSTDLLGFVTHFNYSYGTTLTETTTNPHHIQTIQIYDFKQRNAELLKKNNHEEIIQQSKNTFDLNDQLTDLTHTVFNGTAPIKTTTQHWDYGPMGRIERIVEAGIKETKQLYDSKGRLKTIIKPNGDQLYHEYDDLGRLSRYFSRDFDYHYTYDLHDCLLSVYDSVTKTKTTRAYDSLNNMIQEDLAHGLSLFNSFDNHSRRISIKLPDASTIAYSYDGVYLFQVQRNGIKHTYAERNSEGELLKSILPGGLGEITFQRDALGRWKKILSPCYTSEFSYDAVGNLTHNTFHDSLGEQKLSYSFDDLDQLISEEEHTYQFDSLYNRLRKDAFDHEVNALCQITHDGQTPYEFDANGNLISDGIRKFFYDSQDRLIAIEKNNKRVEYAYDPFHRRLWKKVFINGKQIKYDRYLWDGNNELGVVDENGVIQELRILGEGLGAEIGAAVLYEIKEKTYVPIHDIQGSVVTLIDLATKRPVECYRYTAYGEELTEDKLSPWRFASKRVEETGLIFFGRRYYYPELGRWITPDPIGFKGGPNLYAYIHNSPLTEMDLYGLLGIGNCFGTLSRMAFRGLEWTGANLVPIPYIRGAVESVGRWGAGGDFYGPSRYRTGKSEIINIPGRAVPHHSYTHGNGMLTSRANAIKQTEYISKTHGDLQVDLLYHGTEGFIMDLIGCGLSKIGMSTSYNKMCANYYQEKLRRDPDHRFTSSVHSRGGTQIMNTGRFLKPEQRAHIDVIAYGSATLIPRSYFNEAKNNLSLLDVVTMTNPLAFSIGLISSKQYNVNLLSPLTGCPLKAHGFLEATYAEEVAKKGYDFRKTYFNE